MPRRFLPLLVVLVSVAGCTVVSSAPTPESVPVRRSPVPETAARPSVLQDPVREPSARAALVRTGQGHTHESGAASVSRHGARPGRGPVPAPPPRRAAAAAPPVRSPRPARHTRPGHRPPAHRQAPRARPASRPPAAISMRDLCRQADGVAVPELVRLCHAGFG
ncbi:hypothetical protein [Streptomyces naphthomycinicus]|uniref:hypothetical protein n=1 Tax=Streptomyces naphthomycinicus TaxID=2872625 RepID=UPI001CEDDCCF|nr:hypothetical protein [Streptomyces sp. TML10]